MIDLEKTKALELIKEYVATQYAQTEELVLQMISSAQEAKELTGKQAKTEKNEDMLEAILQCQADVVQLALQTNKEMMNAMEDLKEVAEIGLIEFKQKNEDLYQTAQKELGI